MNNTLDLSFNDINKSLNNSNANYCNNIGEFLLLLCNMGSSTESNTIKSIFSIFELSFEKIYNTIDINSFYRSSYSHNQFNILSIKAVDLSKIVFSLSSFKEDNENESYIQSGYITRNSSTDDNYAVKIHHIQRIYNFREVTPIIGESTKEDIQTWLKTNFKDVDDLKDASTRNIYMIYNGTCIPLYISVSSGSTTSISIFTNRYISGINYNYIYYAILQSNTLNVSNLFYRSGQLPVTIELDNSILEFDNMTDYEAMNTWLMDIFGSYDDAYIMQFYANTRYNIMDSLGMVTEVLTFHGESAGGDNVKWTLVFFDCGLNKIFKEVITYNPTSGMLNVEKTNI